MAFMKPEIRWCQDFPFVLQHINDEDVWTPAAYADLLAAPVEESYQQHDNAYFARLSAPGYTDATEWCGPFTSLAEAKEHIERVWDVCSECGEDLDDDSHHQACPHAN